MHIVSTFVFMIKDEMEACTSAPEQFRGDSSKGLTTHTPGE